MVGACAGITGRSSRETASDGLPVPLQPGPLAAAHHIWAPVALLFYLFVMLVMTTLRKVDLHP